MTNTRNDNNNEHIIDKKGNKDIKLDGLTDLIRDKCDSIAISPKSLILAELENPGIPNIFFMFNKENLEYTFEILKELLEEEKEKFEKLLSTPEDQICFDTFEDDSKLVYFYKLLAHYKKTINNGEKIRKIFEDIDPLLTGFQNYKSYNKDYYNMFVCCRDKTKLDSDQKRIIDVVILNFELKGINLPKEEQEEIKTINLDLVRLTKKFSDNVLDSQKEFSYVFENLESIKEMPQNEIDIARSNAEKDGLEGYKFGSDINSYLNVLKYCSNPSIRKLFYNTRNKFASEGKFDNHNVIINILKLKQKRASLLGYANYAECSLVNKMADNPDEVKELLNGISERAVKKGKVELEELKNHFGFEILESSDTAYYARILKEQKYDLDEKVLYPFFELQTVLSGLFDITNKLFGIELETIDIGEDFEKHNIQIFKINKDGQFKGYYLLDVNHRDDKTSGAWATVLRSKSQINGKQVFPIIGNMSSFKKGVNGKTLLNLSNLRTVFHEFGHFLHEILSDSKYSDLSGFKVEWDFVEVPSQFMENWCNEKESLQTFAKHFETGETIPEYLLDNLKKAETFQNGMFYSAQSEYSMMDMILHSENIPDSPEELDRKVLEIVNKNVIIPKGSEFKMHTSFSHIFAGGYAAGYYSYLRSQIIEADIFGEFKKNGIFDKETGEKYYKTILSQGSRKPVKELFRDFMGRDVSLDAFFENKGL